VPGHGDVQHDEIGPWRAGIRVCALEKGESFRTIMGHVEVHGERALGERCSEAASVSEILCHH